MNLKQSSDHTLRVTRWGVIASKGQDVRLKQAAPLDLMIANSHEYLVTLVGEH